jgi:WD40 repeat protein
VTPDGKYVVSGSGDKTVRLWELATGKEVRRFTGHADWVRSVAVTPDGQYVVSGSGDKTVRLWDLATGKEVRRFTGHEGRS